MENNLPMPITSDRDLKVYENFLRNQSKNQTAVSKNSYIPDTLTNNVYLPAFLKNHIGKLVKIESLIGNGLESRTGTLMQVGADFVVIKLKASCSSMVIEGRSIKYITIVHDNDARKIGCL